MGLFSRTELRSAALEVLRFYSKAVLVLQAVFWAGMPVYRYYTQGDFPGGHEAFFIASFVIAPLVAVYYRWTRD